MVDLFVIVVETDKEVTVIHPIEHSSSLADRMHAPHRRTHVHALNAGLAGNYRAYRRPARRVISHHEFLNRHFCLFSEDLEYGAGDKI